MKNQAKYPIKDDLLMKYLSGDLSEEESKAVQLFLESDPDHRVYLEEMRKIWNLSSGINEFQSIDKKQDWLTLQERIKSSETSNGSTIRMQSRQLSYRIIRIAAVFLLAFATAFTVYYYSGHGPLSKMQWVTVNVTGQPEGITLPDGTRVFLNARSELSYPVEFKRRTRSIRMNGEAYFEVARNENKPFIVHVSDAASVEVLGTSFNLRTDPEGKRVFLNVASGKVAFYPKGQKRHARLMTQDEQAIYEDGKIKNVLTLDLNFLSWKTKSLQFENTPIENVLDQLGRHYRKEFRIIDQQLDSLTLTGVYSDESIGDVLEEIELVLDIRFEEVNGSIEVKTTAEPAHAD
ncbi:FecR domain-containing protein [Bacteroidota bacterium]